MSEPATFDRLMAALQEAALDPSCWPEASGLVDEAIGATGNSLVVGDGEDTEDIRIFITGFYKRGERRRDLERLYFSHYHALDERLPRLRLMPDSRLVHCRQLYTEEELKHSPCYNELLLLGQAHDSLIVRLDGPAGSRILWSIHNPVDRDGWTSTKIGSLRRLLPHLRQYVRVRQALGGADALGASLADLLERAGAGIVELDRRGRIVAANDRASALLGRGDGLYDEQGALFARGRADNTRLQDLLARALPPFGRRGESGSMTVGRSKGSPPLVLHVTPLGQRDTDFGLWPVAALVLVQDPADSSRLDPTVAAARLGLTPMESRVAVLLAGGKSVREIAATTGRKETTIRWHLKQICEKHGLARQAEVVQLVLSVATTPDYR